MRLYNLADVEAASKAKLAGKRAERILREVNFKIRKEEKKEAALAAIERVKELELAPLPVGGSSALPVHVWAHILSFFMVGINGIHDACMAAREVCNVASVCRDTRLAAADVLRKAASDPDLEKAVADPVGMQKAQLKAVCLKYGWRVGGNKSELALRILDMVGIETLSTTAPVALMAQASRQKQSAWLFDPVLSKQPLSSVISARFDTVPCPCAWDVRRALFNGCCESDIVKAGSSAHKILARCALVQGKNVRDTRARFK